MLLNLLGFRSMLIDIAENERGVIHAESNRRYNIAIALPGERASCAWR
jgi:hypothetical protein